MTDDLTRKIRIAVREARRRELLAAINHKDDRYRMEYALQRAVSKAAMNVCIFGSAIYSPDEGARRAMRIFARLINLNRKYAK